MDKPSLREAKQRIVRAAERQRELAMLVAQLQANNADRPVVVRVDRETFEQRGALSAELDWSAAQAAYSPVDAKMLTGEIVYHLRTALEYVAYNLAWLDSGVVQTRTQFPIVDKATQWKDACRRDLPGLSRPHTDALRAYQPFGGCAWTRTLRDLSNADKHRLLTDVARKHSWKFRISDETATVDPEDPTKMRIAVADWDTGLMLPDGSEAVPVLGALCREVALLLESLQGDFGESDTLTVTTDAQPPN